MILHILKHRQIWAGDTGRALCWMLLKEIIKVLQKWNLQIYIFRMERQCTYECLPIFWLDIYLNKKDKVNFNFHSKSSLPSHIPIFSKGQIKGDKRYLYKSLVKYCIRIIPHPFPFFFPEKTRKENEREKESIIKSLHDKELTVRFCGKWFQSRWPAETLRKSPADLINSSPSSCQGSRG